MARLDDWPDRLAAHVEEWRHKPFKWGRYDCAMFCLLGEKAMCGDSRFADYVGNYESPKGSVRLLRRLGNGDLAENVAQRLPEVPPQKAGRGDVGLIDTPDGDALSLIVGDKVAAMGKDGLVFLPRDAVKRAWKV